MFWYLLYLPAVLYLLRPMKGPSKSPPYVPYFFLGRPTPLGGNCQCQCRMNNNKDIYIWRGCRLDIRPDPQLNLPQIEQNYSEQKRSGEADRKSHKIFGRTGMLFWKL